MIKRIIVGVDGSEHSRSALRYAIWLSRNLGATLTGLHVVDIVSIEGSFFHDISGSLGFEPYLDFTSKMREALQERGASLLEEFTSTCKTEGVQSETALQIGIVPSEICERAREADLVVLGNRGVNQRFTTGLLGGVTESVTRQCPKPVLVTPLEFQSPRRPVLAYDGSQRASAAMHVAAEVCTELKLPLAVLTVCRDRDQGERTLDQARRYLASYSLETTTSVAEGHAYETIPAWIRDKGYDLVFMGSHGHGRMIELVLGSTTEYVLRNVPCPVFLSR
jgi:nucleotide-binding universal stress UspA family protein